jgi:hypothetical protein
MFRPNVNSQLRAGDVRRDLDRRAPQQNVDAAIDQLRKGIAVYYGERRKDSYGLLLETYVQAE